MPNGCCKSGTDITRARRPRVTGLAGSTTTENKTVHGEPSRERGNGNLAGNTGTKSEGLHGGSGLAVNTET